MKTYLSRLESIAAINAIKSRNVMSFSKMSTATLPLFNNGLFMCELTTLKAFDLADKGVITIHDGLAEKV